MSIVSLLEGTRDYRRRLYTKGSVLETADGKPVTAQWTGSMLLELTPPEEAFWNEARTQGYNENELTFLFRNSLKDRRSPLELQAMLVAATIPREPEANAYILQMPDERMQYPLATFFEISKEDFESLAPVKRSVERLLRKIEDEDSGLLLRLRL